MTDGKNNPLEDSLELPQPNTSASPVSPVDPAALPTADPVDPASTNAPIVDPAAPSVVSDAPSGGDAPDLADDVDVIEKEWVNKAKQIVDETKSDPHRQKDRLSEFKADYMKKRYNKDISLDDIDSKAA